MKRFIDGDQMCFTLDTFENLQESPAIFVPLDDENVKAIIDENSLYAASGAFLVDVFEKLHAVQSTDGAGEIILLMSTKSYQDNQ